MLFARLWVAAWGDFTIFLGVFMVVKLAPKPHNPANKWQWPILINNKWWWRNVPPSTPMLFARLYLAAWGGDGPRRAYLARKPMMTTLMIVQVFISNSLGHHIVRINFRTCLQTGQKTIHAKNVWCCGEGYFGQKQIAERVRKSRQNVNRDKSA